MDSRPILWNWKVCKRKNTLWMWSECHLMWIGDSTSQNLEKLILLISVEETLGDYLSSAVMLSAIFDGSHYQTSQHGYHSSTTKDWDLQQKPTTTKFGSIIIFDMFAAILNATHSQNRAGISLMSHQSEILLSLIFGFVSATQKQKC